MKYYKKKVLIMKVAPALVSHDFVPFEPVQSMSWFSGLWYREMM